MRRRALALGAALVVAAVLARITAPRLETEAHYKPSEFEEAKESIALSLMGQLRMSVGDLMWLKTLEYLHNGIIYRPPTKRERAQGVRAVEFTGMGAGVAHADGPSLVPDAERDWRGILGDINRQIEPYRPGHARHSDPQELIPWYQLLTKFNPNYIQAYTVGALFMSDFAREPEKARDFLKAGAQANPWSFEIQAALGRLYFDYFEEYREAGDALQKAVELAKKERQYLAERDDHLDEPQTQLLNEAYLFLARSYTELGRYEDALSVCAEGSEKLQYPLLRVQERIIKKRMAP